MELTLAGLDFDKVRRQRNLFLSLLLITIISNLLLVIKISSVEERIIMVPGISQEMSVTDGRVSSGYLEESAMLFLSALLDLTPDTVEHKRNMVLKYTSSVDPKYLKQIKNYFASSESEHKRFKLSTYFTPKSIQLNEKKLRVLASGMLISSFGKKGYEQREAHYLLSFELVGGHLKLKEFFEVDNKGKVFSVEKDKKKRG